VKCAPVVALSLNGLRRQIEALLVPEDAEVVLELDRAARPERDPAPPGVKRSWHAEPGSACLSVRQRSVLRAEGSLAAPVAAGDGVVALGTGRKKRLP
jgi:hypothetical protein